MPSGEPLPGTSSGWTTCSRQKTRGSWTAIFLAVMLPGMDPDKQSRLIGRQMAELRKRAGRSQATVAEKLGVVQGTISKWERGQLPVVTDLIRYADAIGVTLLDLAAPVVPEGRRPLDPRARELAESLARVLAEEEGDA